MIENRNVFVKYVAHPYVKIAPKHKVLFCVSCGSKEIVGSIARAARLPYTGEEEQDLTAGAVAFTPRFVE
jgi:hypothetical protein